MGAKTTRPFSDLALRHAGVKASTLKTIMTEDVLRVLCGVVKE